jgi:hypothetical protein
MKANLFQADMTKPGQEGEVDYKQVYAAADDYQDLFVVCKEMLDEGWSFQSINHLNSPTNTDSIFIS